MPAPRAENRRRLAIADEDAPTPAIDRDAWRIHRPWHELALAAGTSTFDAAAAPDLFADDVNLERFLAAAHGQRA